MLLRTCNCCFLYHKLFFCAGHNPQEAGTDIVVAAGASGSHDLLDDIGIFTDTPTTAVDTTAGNVLRLTPAGSESPSSDGEVSPVTGEVSPVTVEPTAPADEVTAAPGEIVPDVIGDGASSTANTTGIKLKNNV